MNNPDLKTRVGDNFHQISLLQSKKKVSGEISKEPFLDILLTDLEQSSFSFILQNQGWLRKEAKLTRLKTSSYLFCLEKWVVKERPTTQEMGDLCKKLCLVTHSENKLCLLKPFFVAKVTKLRFVQLCFPLASQFQLKQNTKNENDNAIDVDVQPEKSSSLCSVRMYVPSKSNYNNFQQLDFVKAKPKQNFVLLQETRKKCTIFKKGSFATKQSSLSARIPSSKTIDLQSVTKQSFVQALQEDLNMPTDPNIRKKKDPILCLLKIGDYVHCGDKIGYDFSTPVVISESGRIVRINQKQITIQKMQPVLFYSQAEIHVENNEWVKRGTPILTLTHQTLVTGDIVQGIPRIEQLFEASTGAPPGTDLQDIGSPSDDDSSKKSSIDNYLKWIGNKTETTINLLPSSSLKGALTGNQFENGEKRYDPTVHSETEEKALFLYKTLQSQVRETFRRKWDQFPLPVAVRQSLEEIQQIIVESIQKVYISQGVLIADKHIEIIVRQMTSKAQVFEGGSTGLLIDEICSLQQIENANISTPGQKALYLPVVMGLTRAALSSDSFVSAASFQETTRVLSRDAVAGKTDFLRGLKEKVIIGDLIDAGTGLDAFYVYSLFSKKIFENKLRDILNRKVSHKTLKKLVLRLD